MNYLTNIEGLSWSRAKVTAPAPAKYPGSETLVLHEQIQYENSKQCLNYFSLSWLESVEHQRPYSSVW